jgi:predicted phosphodiesterase
VARVAALYDVHGNLPALEAVLADVPDDAVIVVGGDIVAGLFPSETLECLRGLGARVRWLRGNADRELMPGEEGLAPSATLDWVRAKLSTEQIEFLHGLPASVTLDVDGVGRVLFVHATARNDVDIFTERTLEERVAPCFAGIEADVVVCGHTHVQFDRDIAGLRVVNAGSVGMAYEDEPGAYWLLLDGGIELRRSVFEPRVSDYPEDWPSATRDEAVSYFETLAVNPGA